MNQNINISPETIQRVLGEKELVILILRSKVEELEKEIETMKANPGAEVTKKDLKLAN